MFANIRRLTFFASLSFLGVASLAEAAPRPLWPVPALSSFDGSHWGDLQIGVTTFTSIRDRYETGRGAYDKSTELTQAKGAPARVDCLWRQQGKEEVLAAISVRFNGLPPRTEDVEKVFCPNGEPVSDWYWAGRNEEWRVEQIPTRGVGVFSLRGGDVDAVPLLILAPFDNLHGLETLLTANVTPVEERVDPHRYEPKVMAFNNISIKLDDDLDLPDWEHDRLKDRIKDAYAQGTLRYDRYGSGSYQVTMQGSKKRDSGSVSVTVSIEGDGPYAPISVTGSGSDTWKYKDRDENKRGRDEDLVMDAWHDALRDARHEAENNFAHAMLAQGPPSISSIREAQWAHLVDSIRFYVPRPAVDNTVVNPILR